MKTLLLFVLCSSIGLANGSVKIYFNGRTEIMHVVQKGNDGSIRLYSTESNSTHWYSATFLKKYQIK